MNVHDGSMYVASRSHNMKLQRKTKRKRPLVHMLLALAFTVVLSTFVLFSYAVAFDPITSIKSSTRTLPCSKIITNQHEPQFSAVFDPFAKEYGGLEAAQTLNAARKLVLSSGIYRYAIQKGWIDYVDPDDTPLHFRKCSCATENNREICSQHELGGRVTWFFSNGKHATIKYAVTKPEKPDTLAAYFLSLLVIDPGLPSHVLQFEDEESIFDRLDCVSAMACTQGRQYRPQLVHFVRHISSSKAAEELLRIVSVIYADDLDVTIVDCQQSEASGLCNRRLSAGVEFMSVLFTDEHVIELSFDSLFIPKLNIILNEHTNIKLREIDFLSIHDYEPDPRFCLSSHDTGNFQKASIFELHTVNEPILKHTNSLWSDSYILNSFTALEKRVRDLENEIRELSKLIQKNML